MEYVPIWLRDEREEGIKIGEEKGKEEKAIEAAKKMLEDGLPIETISKYTGLTEKEIKEFMFSQVIDMDISADLKHPGGEFTLIPEGVPIL